jgi:hypothetical protein
VDVLVVPAVAMDVPVMGEWIGPLDGSVNADIRPKIEGYVLRQTYKEGRIRYEAATVNAFGEVSRALVDRTKLVETERQRARAVAAYQEAVRLANVRYARGSRPTSRCSRPSSSSFRPRSAWPRRGATSSWPWWTCTARSAGDGRAEEHGAAPAGPEAH